MRDSGWTRGWREERHGNNVVIGITSEIFDVEQKGSFYLKFHVPGGFESEIRGRRLLLIRVKIFAFGHSGTGVWPGMPTEKLD